VFGKAELPAQRAIAVTTPDLYYLVTHQLHTEGDTPLSMDKILPGDDNTTNGSPSTIEQLKSLIPEAFADDGKLNVENLKQLLGEEVSESGVKFGLEWLGREDAVMGARDETSCTLKPVQDDDIGDDSRNMLIEGDNIDVLRILKQSYRGRIKMIYIDPPYNTGNDLIYDDDFSDLHGSYMRRSGQISESGEILDTDTETSGKTHRKWLSMMWPRLKLLHDLLHKDGVIFISIDDNEMHHLRSICDSIFGNNNHVATIPLEITKTQGMKKKAAEEGSVVKNHEYIMCYSKTSGNKKIVKNLLFDHRPGYDTHYSVWIDKPDKPGKIKKLTEVLADDKKMYAEFQRLGLLKKDEKITNPMIASALLISPTVQKFIYEEHAENIFQEMMAKINVPDDVKAKLKNDTATLHNGYLLKNNGSGNMIQLGQLSRSVGPADDNAGTFGLRTIRGSLWKGVYSDMMNVAKEGGEVPFKNGKKPVRLIKQLAHWIGVGQDDIVLDAFAGSGTTGEVAMQMNVEDNGNRRFILIQWAQDLSEPKGDDQKEAAKFCRENDLPLNIISLTKERLKRVHQNILKEHPDSSANLGFKMYKYVPSNINNWNNPNPEDLQKTLEEFINVVNEDSTMLDIFTEMTLKYGIDLAAPVNISSVGDHEIFEVDNGRMLACFSNEKISSDSIPDIAKELIQKKNNGNHESNCIAIFLDNSFEDDEAKTNLKLDLESGGFAPSYLKCI